MINIDTYLNNFYKGSSSPSLKSMKYFMDIYDDFEKEMKFIHIAGTNGKGSCTEIISNILVTQGYKVGKFLSPHLIKYNERISINGINISDKDMINLITELTPLINSYKKISGMNITLFELETMIALLYFYRNHVDFIVLETGLGGLYDSTNIISKPLVSVITSIGYDHQHILGNTLPEIAYQKAGIIKKCSNTVIFEQSPEINKLFIDECNLKNNNLHIVRHSDISNYSFDYDFQYFNYKDIKNLCINLKGKAQIYNACLCIETVKILNELGYSINIENIKEGLKSVIHKGRVEQLSTSPLIVYDGAHNEQAIENFQNIVKMYYNDYKKIYIVSILKRKDYKKILKLLSSDKDATFVLTSGNDSNRYLSSADLYEYLETLVEKSHIIQKSLEDAITDAMNSDNNTANFIVGSFYIYGTVINRINQIKLGKS